jgi:methionine sulfoxide reductase heme-binding subunit
MAKPLAWLKPAVATGALVPVASFIWRGTHDQLGANPISEVLNELGLLALIFLTAGLACTPLKVLFGWTWPVRIRRWLGVIGFGYATCHVFTYLGVDQVFDWKTIIDDIFKRPFIFFGFAAWVLLLPLAVTSTDGMVKRLGFKRWQLLHRLTYFAVGLAVVHFFLRVKKDVSEPVIYGVLAGTLLLVRAFDWARKRQKKSAPRSA